jgi:hypothetical protein
MSLQIAFSDAPVVTIPVRDCVLENLAALRQEWEAAVGGDSLLDVTGSVGLMLLDVATKLGLTPEERAFFLGAQLDQEASSILLVNNQD